ncbi:MAG: tyrosine-type recombinase/integrase [Ekhidna sp.]|nr:tyrosine-type recombinase/integrase [Ekhidna sp.]
MLIFIRGGKGKKDRYTLLSKKILLLLSDYYKSYNPKCYLFEGKPGTPYSASSAGNIFKRSKKSARINTNITLHSLRHSSAAHLLENDTDLRYIQELLGHKSPKITMIHTHVTNRSLQNIKNPLEETEKREKDAEHAKNMAMISAAKGNKES